MKTFDLVVTDIQTGTIARITVTKSGQGVTMQIGRATWALSEPDATELADALCGGLKSEALLLTSKWEEIAVLLKRKAGMSLEQFIRTLYEEKDAPPSSADAVAPPPQSKAEITALRLRNQLKPEEGCCAYWCTGQAPALVCPECGEPSQPAKDLIGPGAAEKAN